MKNKQPKPSVAQKVKDAAPSADIPAKIPFARRLLLYGCLAAVMLFVCFVRYRLLNIPLERDEGEYALMGQMILKGIPPYEMAYNMKLPGTYYMYALLMGIFGQNVAGIHLGMLLVNLTSILLLFLIGKKMFNDLVALVAAASFALMSLSEGVLGCALHATHFNVLFALCGMLALLHYAERPGLPRLIVSGFCFGLSFVMKQQAVFLMLFGLSACWIIERQRAPFQWKNSLPRFGAFGFAMLLPYLLIVLSACLSGTFDKFWHWTVGYARQYVGIKNADDAWHYLELYFPIVSKGFWAFWIAGVLGLAALFFSEGARKYHWMVLSFALCSLACVVPGLYFRPHYFVVFLPALALLTGITLNFFREILLKQNRARLAGLPYLVFAGMFGWAVSVHSEVFFKYEPDLVCLINYSASNPFLESVEIAKFIQSNTTGQDRIAIIGSEPQIYFYSKRLPATGYIYTYPLMENQPYSLEMQHEMMAEVEKARPKYLLFINLPYSWMRSDKSSKDIFNWYERYNKNYNLVGAIELNPNGRATYTWREALGKFTQKSQNIIWVYELK